MFYTNLIPVDRDYDSRNVHLILDINAEHLRNLINNTFILYKDYYFISIYFKTKVFSIEKL